MERRLRFAVWSSLGFVVIAALVAMVIHTELLHPPRSATLEDEIPNERMLIAAGRSGVPAPGQPTEPLAVDRVVRDSAHVYVAYHYTVDPGQRYVPTPILALSDDRGNLESAGGDAQCERTHPSWSLPSWLPWHTAAVIHCLDREDVALPSTARAVVIALDAQLSPVILPSFPAPSHMETVRVQFSMP